MITLNNDRSCGECTMCCQGYLFGEAYGFNFQLGKPCHYVRKSGCSIYDYRPYNPCKTYKCEWKKNKNIPEEFRPDKAKVILTERVEDDRVYLQVLEAGGKISDDMLHLIIKLFNDHKYDWIRYSRNGEWHELKR